MAVFQNAWEISKDNEGGYGLDPHDAGGETYRGIARAYEKSWSGWQLIDEIKRTSGPIKTNFISPELDRQAMEFYRVKYWNGVGGGNLKNQAIANIVYDSTLSGLPRAIAMIKVLLNHSFGGKFEENGTMTQQVVDAINKADQQRFFQLFKGYRSAMYKYSAGALTANDPFYFLSSFFARYNKKPEADRQAYGSRYLQGWLNRVEKYSIDLAQTAEKHKGGIVLLALTATVATLAIVYREPIKKKLTELFVPAHA